MTIKDVHDSLGIAGIALGVCHHQDGSAFLGYFQFKLR